LTLEPRYYYNLENRNSRGKKTSKNSGNYFSLKTSYHPDWFVLNLDENITKTADLSIIYMGIKRQIGYRIGLLKTKTYYNGSSQNVDDVSTNRNQYTPYYI
jgi:hypothetical protein